MPRIYIKRPKKRLKVIVANPKTPKEYAKMIDDLNKTFRELHSVREVKYGYLSKNIENERSRNEC
ncbi:MAG: hypothetical protein PHG03_01765 [Bacilli bacterium]|nr:hypothetical protein [Bacilli bacterium]MDD4795272.1 hypothetical protein [Bacilli bacterium]